MSSHSFRVAAACVLMVFSCTPPVPGTATWPGEHGDVPWGDRDPWIVTELAAPPGVLRIEAPALLAVGGATSVVVTGAKPFANLALFGSLAQSDQPAACPRSLGGACLGLGAPARLLLAGNANASGSATIPISVGAPFGPFVGALQVAEKRRGVVRLSNVATVLLDTPGGDYDRDGLLNGDEVEVHGTRPDLADSDGGGLGDGAEVLDGKDPRAAGDDVLAVASCDGGDATGSPHLGPLACVAPGSFVMGCVAGRDDVAGDCDAAELPARTVTRTWGAWMMRSEVQEWMWSELFNLPEGGGTCGTDCPVGGSTWWDALAFANAVSELEGLPSCYVLDGCTGNAGAGLVCEGFRVDAPTGQAHRCAGWRLPTEVEWEAAARASGAEAWPGSDDPLEVAVAGAVAPSCTLSPNAWGFCDLAGNVAEWVHESPYGLSGSAAVDPQGPSVGQSRILRGGGHADDPAAWRSAGRAFADADVGTATTGLRLVRTAMADTVAWEFVGNDGLGCGPLPIEWTRGEVGQRWYDNVLLLSGPNVGQGTLDLARLVPGVLDVACVAERHTPGVHDDALLKVVPGLDEAELDALVDQLQALVLGGWVGQLSAEGPKPTAMEPTDFEGFLVDDRAETSYLGMIDLPGALDMVAAWRAAGHALNDVAVGLVDTGVCADGASSGKCTGSQDATPDFVGMVGGSQSLPAFAQFADLPYDIGRVEWGSEVEEKTPTKGQPYKVFAPSPHGTYVASLMVGASNGYVPSEGSSGFPTASGILGSIPDWAPGVVSYVGTGYYNYPLFTARGVVPEQRFVLEETFQDACELGVDVLNYSMGLCVPEVSDDPTTANSQATAIYRQVLAQCPGEMLLVEAAGNDSADIDIDCPYTTIDSGPYDMVVSIGAAEELSMYPELRVTNLGPNVELIAPGHNGTSFAAPLVTGSIGLLLAVDRDPVATRGGGPASRRAYDLLVTGGAPTTLGLRYLDLPASLAIAMHARDPSFVPLTMRNMRWANTYERPASDPLAPPEQVEDVVVWSYEPTGRLLTITRERTVRDDLPVDYRDAFFTFEPRVSIQRHVASYQVSMRVIEEGGELSPVLALRPTGVWETEASTNTASAYTQEESAASWRTNRETVCSRVRYRPELETGSLDFPLARGRGVGEQEVWTFHDLSWEEHVQGTFLLGYSDNFGEPTAFPSAPVRTCEPTAPDGGVRASAAYAWLGVEGSYAVHTRLDALSAPQRTAPAIEMEDIPQVVVALPEDRKFNTLALLTIGGYDDEVPANDVWFSGVVDYWELYPSWYDGGYLALIEDTTDFAPADEAPFRFDPLAKNHPLPDLTQGFYGGTGVPILGLPGPGLGFAEVPSQFARGFGWIHAPSGSGVDSRLQAVESVERNVP